MSHRGDFRFTTETPILRICVNAGSRVIANLPFWLLNANRQTDIPMLSYRHSFHAGNHADVLKHIVQSLIITALKEKEKPFLYLDTHAGAGRYQLSSEQATKTQEYLSGIARIWQQPDLPETLLPYIDAIKALNPQDTLKFYPGSPLIARHLLRPQDKLQLTELHPGDFPLLRGEFRHDERAIVARSDGFQQLKAKLPPVSRRGFVLMDPPYEMKTDYQSVIDSIVEGYKRFGTGVYALWYPVVIRSQIKRLCRGIEATGIRSILQIELAIRPDSSQHGMTGSGMIVINPPWKLEQQMRALLPWLHQKMAPAGSGHTRVQWLVAE